MYFSGSDQRLVGYGAGGKAEAPPGFGATRGARQSPASCPTVNKCRWEKSRIWDTGH